MDGDVKTDRIAYLITEWPLIAEELLSAFLPSSGEIGGL
jgi:hypothetical protein